MVLLACNDKAWAKMHRTQPITRSWKCNNNTNATTKTRFTCTSSWQGYTSGTSSGVLGAAVAITFCRQIHVLVYARFATRSRRGQTQQARPSQEHRGLAWLACCMNASWHAARYAMHKSLSYADSEFQVSCKHACHTYVVCVQGQWCTPWHTMLPGL